MDTKERELSEAKKPVGIAENASDTWMAWIYNTTFTGTREACIDWLRGNGEETL
jgi:hypothetical protein